jgi:uncharacterized membrane protein
LSALFGLVATWWLAKTLFSKRVAAWAVFIVAFNPLFLSYAVEGRPYSLFLFLSVLSIGTYWQSLRQPSRTSCCLHVLSSVLLVYSHYFGFLVLLAETLFFFMYVIAMRKACDIKRMLLAFSAIGLLSLPALWLISRYVLSGGPGLAGWIVKPGYKTLLLVGLGDLLFESPTFSILCFWAVVTTLWTLFESVRRRGTLEECHASPNHDTAWGALLCLVWFAASYYLFVVASFLTHPILVNRYVLPAMVPCAILLSAVTCKIARSAQILVLLLIVAAYYPQVKSELAETRNDYPQLTALIRQSNHEKDMVYVVGCADYPYYRSAMEVGLRYYDYDEPNIALLKLTWKKDQNVYQIREPSLLQTDNRYFVVSHWQGYEKPVDEWLEKSSREYKKRQYGPLTLFEVNK